MSGNWLECTEMAALSARAAATTAATRDPTTNRGGSPHNSARVSSTTEMGTIVIPTIAGTTPPLKAEYGNSMRLGVTKAVNPATSGRPGARKRASTNMPSGNTTDAKTTVKATSTRPTSAFTRRVAIAEEACTASG